MSLPTPSTSHLTVPPGPSSSPSAQRPFILVPLYIYPAPGAWDPVYTAAASLADVLDFYVVINPANGPGPGLLPDANYVEALERLTALGNVKVIGYVHCSYGLREAEGIVKDVERYAAWEGEREKAGGQGQQEGQFFKAWFTEPNAVVSQPIVVDGIFIDETPSSTQYVQYLAALANAIKTILNRNGLDTARLTALTESDQDATAPASAAPTAPAEEEEEAAVGTTDTTDDKPTTSDDVATTPNLPPSSGALTPSASSALVIYNPGVVVDPIFYQAADYIVAFENTCAQWAGGRTAAALSRLPRPLVRRSIPVAHSASGPEEVERLGRRAAELGCLGVFVTSQPGYTDWCTGWEGFVADVARRARSAPAGV